VAGRWAVVIAVEKYRHAGWAGVPYAEAAAGKLSAALAAARFPVECQTVLVGPDATAAVIRASIREARRRARAGDTLLVFVSGQTFFGRTATYLAAWDTLLDLRAETAVDVAELVETVKKPKVESALFLDVEGDLNGRIFNPIPTLASCVPGERSLAGSGKVSLWLGLVIDALSRDDAVSLDSIHRHVTANLPTLLRRYGEPGAIQTPQRFGSKKDVPIRSARPKSTTPVLDPSRLARVVFRGETRVRMKDLAGFRKSFTVPTAATPAARAFVARLAKDELESDLDRTYEAVREQFGYKRKELDRGPGVLRLPDFEYAVSVDLDPDDPSVAMIRRDATRFHDAAFVRSPEFSAFGKRFDSLVFEFAEPIDVTAFVDHLEDLPKSVAILHPSPDGKSCEVTLPGVAGRVVVERTALTVRGRSAGTAGLVDILLNLLAVVGPVGDPARALTRGADREQ
jgi:hypothetical protein